MTKPRQVVITGLGVVSPIGIGRQAFAKSLAARTSGVRRITLFDPTGLKVDFGAEVLNFDGKQYVTPRKSLKVMSREIQLGFTAAQLACEDSGLQPTQLDPDRFGVVFGADMTYGDLLELVPAYRACIAQGKFSAEHWGTRALAEMYPLWLLKNLPNMSACHIAIALDARGPNNSIINGEVSSLLAVTEAVRVLERGQADVVIAGGTGSRLHPMISLFQSDCHLSHRASDPAAASRPFDADRDGTVQGEGAAAFILETREHAAARGAQVQARVLGCASAFEPRRDGPLRGTAVRASIAGALRESGLTARDIGHVNAHGASTIEQDRAEAQAIRAALGDVPVTAPKSYFGNLGAAGGAVEMAVSLHALATGTVSPTLNYEHPDPECPINVVHHQDQSIDRTVALLLNHSMMGQAAAIVLAGPE